MQHPGQRMVQRQPPATAPGPTIGFLAHVDTAPQFNATGVKPRVIRGYNGGAISFPDNPALLLTPEISPYLAGKRGDQPVDTGFIVYNEVTYPLTHSPTPPAPCRTASRSYTPSLPRLGWPWRWVLWLRGCGCQR